MDPATFAIELGILAVRGFGDMGKRARDAMIRDRFIAAQLVQRVASTFRWGFFGYAHSGHCGSLPSVGESFRTGAELGAGRDQDSLGEYDDSQDLGVLQADSQELMVCTVMNSRAPTPVVGVIPRNVETQRKVGNGEGQLAPLEAISSLVTLPGGPAGG